MAKFLIDEKDFRRLTQRSGSNVRVKVERDRVRILRNGALGQSDAGEIPILTHQPIERTTRNFR